MFLVFSLLMCMPVLFPSIARDLELTLGQIGIIWGVASGAGILAALPSGLICDRFGIRVPLGVFVCLCGVSCILRGLAYSFIYLFMMMFIFGLFSISVIVNAGKVARMWFPLEQLGLANGILMGGVTIGGMVAAAISSTYLLTTLGTWRNVMFLWGIAALVMGIIWLIAARERRLSATPVLVVPFRKSMSRVARIKEIWIAAVFALGVLALYQGVSGYLPMFLESIGWTQAMAGGGLSAFVGVGIVTSVLIPALSDRVGLRKVFIIGAAYTLACFTFMIWPLVGTTWPLWVVIITAGLGFGGLFPLLVCLVTELKEVGPIYAGTAYGLVMTVECVGGLLGPTVGNALSSINLTLPFIFWGVVLGVLSVGIFFVRETGARVSVNSQDE